MKLYVQEEWVNATEDYIIGGSEPQEAFTDKPDELYRHLIREYGRCTSKVYIDGKDGKPMPCGWVFVKRIKYEDSPDTYLQETWITLHSDLPERTTKFHYFNLQS